MANHKDWTGGKGAVEGLMDESRPPNLNNEAWTSLKAKCETKPDAKIVEPTLSIIGAGVGAGIGTFLGPAGTVTGFVIGGIAGAALEYYALIRHGGMQDTVETLDKFHKEFQECIDTSIREHSKQ